MSGNTTKRGRYLNSMPGASDYERCSKALSDP